MTFIPNDKTLRTVWKKNDVRTIQKQVDTLSLLEGKIFKSKSELSEFISDKKLPFNIKDFDLSDCDNMHGKIKKSTTTKGSQTETSEDSINVVICNEILGKHWLSDDTLQQYFEILNLGLLKAKRGMIVNPIISHLIKNMNDVDQFLEIIDARNKTFLIIPVNNANATDLEEGTHWSVLAFSQKSKSFYYFDSLQTLNIGDANITKCKFQRYLKINEDEPLIICKCPQQNNSYDCGIYTIFITEYLINDILKGKEISSNCTENLILNEIDLIKKRSYLAYVLNNKNIMDRDTIFSLMLHSHHEPYKLNSSLNSGEKVGLKVKYKSPTRSSHNGEINHDIICDTGFPAENSKKKTMVTLPSDTLCSSKPTTSNPKIPPHSLIIAKENNQIKTKTPECSKKNIKQITKKTVVASQKKNTVGSTLNKKENLTTCKQCTTTPRVKVVSTRQKPLVLKTAIKQ